MSKHTLPTQAKVTYSVMYQGKEYTNTITLTDIKVGSSSQSKSKVYQIALELMESQVLRQIKDDK